MAPGGIDSIALLVGVLAVAVAGAATDLVRGKIYNWLTFPAMAAGIVASTWVHGLSGLGGSVLAIGLGFLLYSWLFVLGAMGAADVKFLMALGAWGGAHSARFVFHTAVLGVVLGGIFAFFSLLFRGRLPAFVRKVWRLVYSASLSVLAREFEVEAPRIDPSLTLPFGIPIAAAAAWAAIADPLVRWGGLWPR
ncbi:MAG: A24 family peptidase [Oligoflexia bacterium]|nr:A24 family peptidase [Oligoflexia bacterium]